MIETLKTRLSEASSELRALLGSWEYAYAMAAGCNGGRAHPAHWATTARVDALERRCRELRAQLAEFEV